MSVEESPIPQAPAATVVLLAPGGAEHVVGPLAQGRAVDLRMIDELARMQLHACRGGRRLLLRDVSDELRGLLQLVGLDGVLAEPAR